MKKIIALVLCLNLVLSLAACTAPDNTANEQTSSNTSATSTTSETQSDEQGTDENVVSNNENNTDTSFEGVSDFEDFKNELDESGYKPTIVPTEDENKVIVELQKPTTDDDDSENNTDTTVTPAIPTIDTVKPTNPTPSKPDTNKEENKPTPEPEKPDTEPTPAPQEPEKPAPQPAPQEPEKPAPQPAPQEPEKPQQPEYTYTTGQKHEKLYYTERYLYSTLNDEQKEWYQAIDEAVNNIDEEVLINSDLKIDKNYYIFHMYLFDNPEHFYLCTTVGVCSNGDGTTTLSFYYSVGNQKGEYCGYGYGPLTDELKDKIKAKKAIFEQEVNRITSTIPANAPDVWKEKLVYDRILMDGYYNLSARWDGLANDNWTAYGLLVNKYGVCESYAEAFQTLCLYVGIKCTGVVGTAGGGHKWNAVELDGEWYMCDITFDDPIGGEQGAAYHYYFNRTSEWFIEYNHDWTNCDFSVPECNGTKYDFENCFGTDRW